MVRNLFFLIIAFLACSGCTFLESKKKTLPSLQKSILAEAHRFLKREDLSYLIIENGSIKARKIAAGYQSMTTEIFEDILDNFNYPMILSKMIKKRLIDENESLDAYTNKLINTDLKINDLIFTKKNCPDILRLSQLERNYLISNIIRKNPLYKSVLSGNNFRFLKEQHTSIRSFYNEIIDLNTSFEKQHPEFNPLPKAIKNIFPSWYTENMELFFGWHVFNINNCLFLWDNFQDSALEVTIVRYPQGKNLIVMIYPSGAVPSPFDLKRIDLLQSPVGLAIIKGHLIDDNQPDNLFYQSVDSIKKRILPYEKTPLQAIFHKELYLQANTQRCVNIRHADSLFQLLRDLTKDSLYVKYMEKPALAEISYVSNYTDASVPFSLDKRQKLRVYAGGQSTLRLDYGLNAYQYDNIQLLINPEGREKVRSKEKTKIFQFNYGTEKGQTFNDVHLKGTWLTNPNVDYAIKDDSDTTFIIEVKIPWREFNFNSRISSTISLNILAGDSDLEEDNRTSILSLSTTPGENWDDVSKFAKLTLTTPGFADRDKRSRYYSIYCASPVDIDGLQDPAWQTAPSIPVQIPYQKRALSSDHAVEFRSLWNQNHIYFLFRVADNCKTKLGLITRDKCWIEDATNGEIVWKLGPNGIVSGPTLSQELDLTLNPGSYVLRYRSDKNHSYEKWFGPPPANDVYGGMLFIK